MIIRSQNKREICNFKNADCISVSFVDKIVAAFMNDGRCLELGVYSAEEKALKVLDMIQNRYINIEYSDSHDGYYDRIKLCFQIPQDNEVEE